MDHSPRLPASHRDVMQKSDEVHRRGGRRWTVVVGAAVADRDDLDLEWGAVFEAAARTGTVLEMNGSPHRLDLSAERARGAVAAGCLVSIDSDAHRTGELEDVRWGVIQARRAWVGPSVVLNPRPRADLLAWVAANPDRTASARHRKRSDP